MKAPHRNKLCPNLLAMHKILVAALVTISLLGCKPPQPAPSGAQRVFVQIPDHIDGRERRTKYQEPLHAVLMRERVGAIAGGGVHMSAPDAEGKKSVEWVALEVSLSDFEKGLPILKRELLQLGAPDATTLKYTRGDKTVEEKLR